MSERSFINALTVLAVIVWTIVAAEIAIYF